MSVEAINRPATAEPPRITERGRKAVTKAAQRQQSTRRLLDLARREFIAKGYDATTVDQIAAGAGLSKGAVYFYFKSKANLLLARIDEAEQLTVQPGVTAIRQAAGSARDQLVAFVHSQSLVGQRHADRMLLLTLMSIEFSGRGGPIEARLRAVHDTMAGLLTEVVSAGQTEGVIAATLPTRELASVIMAVNQGCFIEWYRRREELSGAALVRALRTTVLHGILLPGS
jgi:AcrR family transcriptional regulator